MKEDILKNIHYLRTAGGWNSYQASLVGEAIGYLVTYVETLEHAKKTLPTCSKMCAKHSDE